MNKIFQKYFPKFCLLGFFLYNLIYSLYVVWYTDTLSGDTLEHIHSAWLVHTGFVPYKDFFQHHNPLLWYILAPLIGLHEKGVDDVFMLSFAQTVSLFMTYLTYYYIYLITSRFFSDKIGGLIAISIMVTPYVLLAITALRPDYFMLVAFFSSLYYYFCYLKDKKLWQLSLSMVLFWCSFMFLQKIVFTLIIMGIITLYLTYQKKIKLIDLLYSLLLPTVLSLGFISYLYMQDILSIWYQSNFTFNLHIPELFTDRRIGIFWIELKIMLVCSILIIFIQMKKATIYFRILSILFVAELIQRRFFFSAFAYYFLELVYISAILSAVFFRNILMKKKPQVVYLLIILLGMSMYKPDIYNGNIGNRKSRFYKPITKEILAYITPCDYVINGDGACYNLYNRDPHYYWNLIGQLDVIGDKVGIHPLMDINNIIETYKPKIIYGNPYKNKYYTERGQDVIVHNPDKALINKYYKPYNNTNDLYILKPEYSKLKCDYDYKKKYYHAYD